MAGLYFEELAVGRAFDHAWTRTVTEMDNVLFSTMSLNPQPLHLDAHARRGRLVRSHAIERVQIGRGIREAPARGERQGQHLARERIGGTEPQERPDDGLGDAGATEQDRNAATLARWIIENKPAEVYVRNLLREVRLPGLTTAEKIHAAAKVLVEADWLRDPPKGDGHRGRAAYAVNPQVWEMSP